MSFYFQKFNKISRGLWSTKGKTRFLWGPLWGPTRLWGSCPTRNKTTQREFQSKRGSFLRVHAIKEQGFLKEPPVVSITYEEIGLFPRSFKKTIGRFLGQLFTDIEVLVIQEYRFYRYLFLTTVKCIFLLLFVPFVVNLLTKTYLIKPLTEYYWNQRLEGEIFLSYTEQKHAFAELHDFEEKVYFESLVIPKNYKKVLSTPPFYSSSSYAKQGGMLSNFSTEPLAFGIPGSSRRESSPHPSGFGFDSVTTPLALDKSEGWLHHHEVGEKKDLEMINEKLALQEKTIELASNANNASIEAISSLFADFFSLTTLYFLLIVMDVQISVAKSFLVEVFFGLDDSKKSLVILLVTDLLVGYHSDGPWAILFESLFNRYGFTEQKETIMLLVATLPVLLDVFFKYLIFRHLNRSSPASVATYHSMIE